MAKSKKKIVKPVNDPPLDDKKGQVRVLTWNSETYVKHRIECFLCLKSDSERDVSEEKFAEGLYEGGWRVILSGDTIGAACPECVGAAKKDKKCCL